MEQDRYGFEYFRKLPGEAKLVESVYEFVDIYPEDFDHYRTRVGQPYLLWNKHTQVFERHEITPYTLDTQLIPYLDRGELFLLPLYSS